MGNWAGPLIVAAVAVPTSWVDMAVKDSKVLSAAARVRIVRRYRADLQVSRVVHITPPSLIDQIGAWHAAIRAHNEVHQALEAKLRAVDPNSHLLHIVDGFENASQWLDARITPLSKADTFVPAVSLASCFAKVIQCELMRRASERFPGYGFEKHCGYGTPQHQEALLRLGVVEIHRKSYRPIRNLITNGAFTDRRG
jgi:ribonuclease HII